MKLLGKYKNCVCFRTPQQLLNSNVELLQSLNKAQNERLSSKIIINIDDNEQTIG